MRRIDAFTPFNSTMKFVKDIPLPEGFEHIKDPQNCFGEWLMHLPLRANNTIFLYNKKPSPYQQSHYAVIDISTGDKDLQQCADCIMRLRTEYFYSRNEYDKISFPTGNHSNLNFIDYSTAVHCNNRNCLMNFMEKVFINCGTYTLQQQLKPVADFSTIKAGDVLIKGGAPGHAMLVVAVAENKLNKKKIYMLLQGFMPAQDMHIVLNALDANSLGPWYEISNNKVITTPGYVFTSSQLRRW